MRPWPSTGASIRLDGKEGPAISGISARDVGQAAAREGFVVYELTSRGHTLEDVFMELTSQGGRGGAS